MFRFSHKSLLLLLLLFVVVLLCVCSIAALCWFAARVALVVQILALLYNHFRRVCVLVGSLPANIVEFPILFWLDGLLQTHIVNNTIMVALFLFPSIRSDAMMMMMTTTTTTRQTVPQLPCRALKPEKLRCRRPPRVAVYPMSLNY